MVGAMHYNPLTYYSPILVPPSANKLNPCWNLFARMFRWLYAHHDNRGAGTKSTYQPLIALVNVSTSGDDSLIVLEEDRVGAGVGVEGIGLTNGSRNEGINSFRIGDEPETDNEVTGQLEFETVSVNVPSGDDLLIGLEEERSGLGGSGLTNGLKIEGINSFRTGDDLETDNEVTGQLEFETVSVNVPSGDDLLIGL